MVVESGMRLHSLVWPDPIPHRGKGSGTWPQSNLLPRYSISKSSHNVSDGNRQSKTCDLSALTISISTVFQLTSCSVYFSRFKFTLNSITCFSYHVTEYCAVIGMHSTVWGNKLLYGHVPDPFPRCGIGSGHTRLVWQ